MAVPWLDQFESALYQIHQVFKRTALSPETFHSLLGISLASCPQEMSWQEQELGNDKFGSERVKVKLFLLKLQTGSLIEGIISRPPEKTL